MTRRGFLCGSMALAAAQLTARERLGERRLRVGVLSDVHVNGPKKAVLFEKALRLFDGEKVDAVLISGDLTVDNRLSEFQLVAETWFKVFPCDRRSDGAKVERLFVTGNHDVDGWAYGRFKSVEEAKPTSFFFHREEFWRKLWHEDYRQVSAKTVKGYTFVLRNWLSILGRESKGHPVAAGFPDEPNPMADFLPTLDLPKDRPFFVVQHEPVADTVNATWLFRGRCWGKFSDPKTKGLYSKHPNAVVLTGHTHLSLTDETSIWQGAFTAVNCSCETGFAFTPPGRENGFCGRDFRRDPPLEMPPIDIKSVRQGMVMDVYDDRIVFRRLEFANGHSLGADWVVPVWPDAPKPYAFGTRLREGLVPAFPKGAKVAVTTGEGPFRGKGGMKPSEERHAQVFVAFPPATTAEGAAIRAWDYAVRLEEDCGDQVRTVSERFYFSPNSLMGEADDVAPVVCAFPRTDLPRNSRADYRFTAVPRSCWGHAGAAISSDWMRF